MDKVEWYLACARGERTAWESLYGFLLGMARKAAFDLDDADRQDLVQKVLLEAHQACPACADTPEAWIPNTVLRLKSRLIDFHRRRTTSPEVLHEDWTGRQEAAVPEQSPERSLLLRQALTAVFLAAREYLGGRCPRVLDLYIRMKAGDDPALGSIDDIATRLDLTANATSVAVHRCVKRLLAVPVVAEALDGML